MPSPKLLRALEIEQQRTANETAVYDAWSGAQRERDLTDALYAARAEAELAAAQRDDAVNLLSRSRAVVEKRVADDAAKITATRHVEKRFAEVLERIS